MAGFPWEAILTSFKNILRALRNAIDAFFENIWRAGFALLGKLRETRTHTKISLFAAGGGKRVAIVAPHPDDETIGAGGVAALHSRAGDAVQIIVVTDGSGSRAGGLSGVEMAKQRRREIAAAADILGASFVWLGLTEWAWENEIAQRALTPLFADADVIYAPSMIDFHPEHRRVAECIAGIVGQRQIVRIYQLGVPLGANLINLVADVSSVIEIKNNALAAHQSQKNAVKPLRRMTRYLSKYYRLRAVECFWELPGDSYASLMQNAAGWSEKNGAFRGIRPHSFTDPLAWLTGRAARKKLANSISGIQPLVINNQPSAISCQQSAIRNQQTALPGEADLQGTGGVWYPALRCPGCRRRLDRQSLRCENGHQFFTDEGVLVLLNDHFSRELSGFLLKFNRVRREIWAGFLQPEDYPLLPFGKAASRDRRWRLRQFDMDVIQPLLKKGNRRILEIGGYNGWLTHHLAAAGHRIMAIDYFLDEMDGLKAKKFYREIWRAIQMDIRDLSVLDATFDVIIVNRCLQFFENPVKYFQGLIQKLSPGGEIYLLGLQFFKNPAAKKAAVHAADDKFFRKFNFQRWLTPVKGYLDFTDFAQLSAQNVELRAYPQLRAENAKALLFRSRPRHFYGIYRGKR